MDLIIGFGLGIGFSLIVVLVLGFILPNPSRYNK